MINEADLLAIDRRFDVAMVQADMPALEGLLADDFVLIDLAGNLVAKRALLEAIGSHQLKFDALDASDVAARTYADAAVVTGVTDMRARQGEAQFAGRSRVTHVYVKQEGQWRMVAAQGTIVP